MESQSDGQGSRMPTWFVLSPNVVEIAEPDGRIFLRLDESKGVSLRGWSASKTFQLLPALRRGLFVGNRPRDRGVLKLLRSLTRAGLVEEVSEAPHLSQRILENAAFSEVIRAVGVARASDAWKHLQSTVVTIGPASAIGNRLKQTLSHYPIRIRTVATFSSLPKTLGRPGGFTQARVLTRAPGLEPPRSREVVVSCTDTPHDELHEQLNRDCQALGVAWLSAAIEADAARVGPFVIPGFPPCYSCYRLRRLARSVHLDLEAAYLAHHRADTVLPASVELLDLTAGILSHEIVSFLLGEKTPELAGHVMGIRLHPRLEILIDEISPVQLCEFCGANANRS